MWSKSARLYSLKVRICPVVIAQLRIYILVSCKHSRSNLLLIGVVVLLVEVVWRRTFLYCSTRWLHLFFWTRLICLAYDGQVSFSCILFTWCSYVSSHLHCHLFDTNIWSNGFPFFLLFVKRSYSQGLFVHLYDLHHTIQWLLIN
jgi:hypothetical protein